MKYKAHLCIKPLILSGLIVLTLFAGLAATSHPRSLISNTNTILSTSSATVWDTASLLSAGRYQSIAIDAADNVHLVWQNDTQILYQQWSNATGMWTAPEVINTGCTGSVNSATCSVDEDGNLHVAWADNTDYTGSAGTGYDIFYKFRNTTTGIFWGQINQTDLISVGSAGPSLDPAIHTLGANIYIVWDDDTANFHWSGDDKDIFFRFWNDTAGAWQGLVNETDLISTESSAQSRFPALAVDLNANVHILWDDTTMLAGDESADWDIYHKYWNASSQTWNSATLVSIGCNDSSWFSTVAIDSESNVHVAWEDWADYPGTGASILYRIWNQTTQEWHGRVNSTDIISLESSYSSEAPALAIDGSDNVHLAWRDGMVNFGGEDDDIFWKVWNATLQEWSTPELVSIGCDHDSEMPRIAIDSTLTPHVVWYDHWSVPPRDSFYDIYYNTKVTPSQSNIAFPPILISVVLPIALIALISLMKKEPSRFEFKP